MTGIFPPWRAPLKPGAARARRHATNEPILQHKACHLPWRTHLPGIPRQTAWLGEVPAGRQVAMLRQVRNNYAGAEV